jgi:hypothetical protein
MGATHKMHTSQRCSAEVTAAIGKPVSAAFGLTTHLAAHPMDPISKKQLDNSACREYHLPEPLLAGRRCFGVSVLDSYL